VGWHKKGKPFLILMKQETIEWQWHQLYNHMQIICTSLQTDDHAAHHSILGWMRFLSDQQRQITKGRD